MDPEISVVMSVYNADKYLRLAIDSILNQSFTNFEFIIIEDCSVDSSLSIIESYSDDRIILLRKNRNKGFKGFVENLNLGLELAKGKYIARMDADDIALPNRFKLQYEFLEKNKDIFMVGSSMQLIDEKGDNIKILKAIENHHDIVKRLNIDNPMYHPTLMFRKPKVRYRDEFKGAEDFDFHLQNLALNKKFSNLSDVLLKYRILKNSLSRKDDNFLKLVVLEHARDSYLNYNNSEYVGFSLERLLNFNSLNLTRDEKKYLLKISQKFNADIYQELIIKFEINNHFIFKYKFFRKLYAKFLIRLNLKIKP